MYGWIPLLFTWGYHNTVNRLCSNIKLKVFFVKNSCSEVPRICLQNSTRLMSEIRGSRGNSSQQMRKRCQALWGSLRLLGADFTKPAPAPLMGAYRCPARSRVQWRYEEGPSSGDRLRGVHPSADCFSPTAEVLWDPSQPKAVSAGEDPGTQAPTLCLAPSAPAGARHSMAKPSLPLPLTLPRPSLRPAPHSTPTPLCPAPHSPPALQSGCSAPLGWG